MPGPFGNVRILVLGAHTGALQFHLRRFPAPGDYLVADGYREAADGAKGSNQAIAAARLGAQVTLLSAVGNDERGRRALDELAAGGVDVGRVLVSEREPTGFGAGFYLSDGSVMGATYVGATVELTPEYLLRHQDVFCSGFDACLVSLEIPLATARAGLELARRAGIPLLILNPSPADDLAGEGNLPPVDILTPNEPEARLLAGLAPGGDEPMSQVADGLASRYHAHRVIVTLGGRGCLVDGKAVRCPTVRAIDTSGAGDCFNSSLAVSLAAGWPLPGAVRFALEAASLSVTRPDSWPAYPTPAEILAFVGHGNG